MTNSLFYTANPDGGYRVISFIDLWKKWERLFGCRYGIADDTVKNVLLNIVRGVRRPGPRAGVQDLPNEPPATGHNYNLDTNAIR